MQIRSKLLTAAAGAVLLPCAGAVAQSSPIQTAATQTPGTQTSAAQTPAAQTVTAQAVTAPDPVTASSVPSAAAPRSAGQPKSLPQDPSSLLSLQDSGLVRPAGSGLKYVPGGTIAGPGNFPVEKAVDGPLHLSLDDAIALGLARNVRLKYVRANQRAVRGYTGQITNALIPNLEFRAASSSQEVDLAALGFKPNLVAPLLASFGLNASSFPTIVKVNTTSAQVNLNQVLFNVPDFELYRAIKPETRAVALQVSDSNEQLVQAVTTAYLQVLADEANLNNAVAQENAAKALLDQAVARDEAGVGIRLDVLRAQVEYQQRQQQHVSADAQVDKDGIQLNRIMGIPAGQELDLTDAAPFAELADLDLEQAQRTAYAHRSDLLALQASLEVTAREVRAVKYQRLPTLAVNGFYGILGLDSGPYHGVFTAQGSLQFPVFREAAQRGEEETAEAQLMSLRDQTAALRGTIDAQIRSSLLDINSADQLVKVSQSNVSLSQQVLSDARDRFTSGVSDNLEVVDALAALTDAQAQLVSALYQYNVAKVGLARNTGVLETRYRAFLGM